MQTGQIPCPSCQTTIQLSVEAVINGSPIVCAGCGLQLKTDTETSKSALDALQRWYDETQDARSRAASSAGDERVQRPRRARRPRR